MGNDIKNVNIHDGFDEIGLTSWHFSKIIKDIFLKVAGLEVLEDKYAMESNKTLNSQISGVVILTGPKTLMISISMPYKSATTLVAYMTDLKNADIRLEEQTDGVTEITNMIAGMTKAQLVTNGFHFSYMQPFTIVGDNHYIIQKSKVNSLNFKFRSGALEMLLTVSIQ